MCANNCIHMIVKSLDITTLYCFFYLSWDLVWCRVSFLKGDLQFLKLYKNTICIVVCTLKGTEKCFIPFTLLHFLPYFVPHTEFKGIPEMSPGMTCIIRLSEIMHISVFKSPLSIHPLRRKTRGEVCWRGLAPIARVDLFMRVIVQRVHHRCCV
jgi:hypothetical protein